jgi:hypothetical protein
MPRPLCPEESVSDTNRWEAGVSTSVGPKHEIEKKFKRFLAGTSSSKTLTFCLPPFIYQYKRRTAPQLGHKLRRMWKEAVLAYFKTGMHKSPTLFYGGA